MSGNGPGVAQVLDRIADHLELKGENPFRVRAFRAAAKTILALPGGVEQALADGSLAAARGIGPATLAIVKEFLETGRSGVLEELGREIPAGLFEILSVPGLGVTRVRLLREKLGIETLADLEAAARDGRLAKLPGLGPRTAEKVLRGAGFVRGKRAFRLVPEASREAELIRAALAAIPGVRRVGVAGELRRRCETVSELGFGLDIADTPGDEILRAVARLPGLTDAAVSGPSQLTFHTSAGTPGRVRVARSDSFGAALVQGTGSEAHLRLLGAWAGERGFGLDPAGGGLRRNGAPVPVPEEADLYHALGLDEIPPEIREGFDEIELAHRGALPRLVERSDLRGMIHCHSSWSDGATGIGELALACRSAGYEYLGLTDHSQAAAYAGGLRPEELPRQWEEIEKLNAEAAGARVLKGIEADILGDGQLDYDEAILGRFDFVIGSVHSRLGMSPPEMTERLLRALDQPALTILGHPTGRLLQSREPAGFDSDRVFSRAAERGVALEINGDPHRLDLDWRLIRLAREHGVMFAIGSDAHGLPGLAYVEYGLGMARKAGLGRDEVMNCRPAAEFLALARRGRA